MIKIVLAVVLAASVLFSYEMDYTKDTVGLVRHLKVYKDPKWVAKIELKNGKKVFFCSPKSMIEFYHRPGKWFDVGVKSEDDFKEILVTDFATLKPINAKGAFYVYGGSPTSPAGDDLPAFATYESAEDFSKTYNGKRIMHFNEISEALIRLLNGRI
ncbi:nitrous oxide reductase accessory protein NosL [Sulfurimonas sp.]|uniref:nitrous oxide reductase accessory protein NosL n=1 Tax=Sulfurimonas sp. TaxID=2022749 RepID=UPI003568CAA7